MSKRWWKSKTIWTGLAGLVTLAGACAAGELSVSQAVANGLPILMGIFLRDGIGTPIGTPDGSGPGQQ
jgi:hypothetical protein